MARNYFDEIINFLGTDTDLFDADFNLAAEELTVVNVFGCSFCEKTYKTKDGLNCHVNMKHTDPVDDSLDCTTLLNLILKTIQSLSVNLCLSLERRCSFSSYIYPEEMLPLLLQEVNKLYSELIIDSNAESFDSAFSLGHISLALYLVLNIPNSWTRGRVVVSFFPFFSWVFN